MAKGYPPEFCQKVIEFVEAGNSRRSTAEHFGVSASFVIKLMKRETETLPVAAEPDVDEDKQSTVEPFSLDVDVSLNELADLLGVASRTISDLAAKGIVHRVGRNRYHLARSIQLFCSRVKADAERKTEDANTDLTVERARLAREQADGHELKNAEMRRELVPSIEVERLWSGEWRKLRSSILSVPSRLRQLLPHLTLEDVEAVDSELRGTLEAFGNGE